MNKVLENMRRLGPAAVDDVLDLEVVCDDGLQAVATRRAAYSLVAHGLNLGTLPAPRSVVVIPHELEGLVDQYLARGGVLPSKGVTREEILIACRFEYLLRMPVVESSRQMSDAIGASYLLWGTRSPHKENAEKLLKLVFKEGSDV